MKTATDLEQSKRLAEILPVESADMHYVRKTHDCDGNVVNGTWSCPKYGNPNSEHASYIVQNFSSYEKLPCWSLAALIEVVKEHDDYTLDICFGGYEGEKYVREWCYTYEQDIPPYNDILSHAEDAVDAMVDLIVKLQEKEII